MLLASEHETAADCVATPNEAGGEEQLAGIGGGNRGLRLHVAEPLPDVGDCRTGAIAGPAARRPASQPRRRVRHHAAEA
jgi:hypothetical protein